MSSLPEIKKLIQNYNLHRLNEICYDKIRKQKKSNEKSKFSEKDFIEFDNCIDKYLQTYEYTIKCITDELNSK